MVNLSNRKQYVRIDGVKLVKYLPNFIILFNTKRLNNFILSNTYMLNGNIFKYLTLRYKKWKQIIVIYNKYSIISKCWQEKHASTSFLLLSLYPDYYLNQFVDSVPKMGIENVDGALVGGASLKAEDFLGICGAYEKLIWFYQLNIENRRSRL